MENGQKRRGNGRKTVEWAFLLHLLAGAFGIVGLAAIIHPTFVTHLLWSLEVLIHQWLLVFEGERPLLQAL